MGYGKIKYVLYSLTLISFASLGETAVERTGVTNQRIRSFHCINGHYIFPNWFCDTVNDCGDASDESYGCTQKCGVGNFTCSDSTCLPISVRCNVKQDCPDGSDELYCDHEPEISDCKIPSGKFLCNDKLRCVDLSLVCDGENHCYDGSDEESKCDDYDPEICNVCHYGCYRTPKGPYCIYNATSETYDDSAKYVERCVSTENYCEQKCVRFHDVNQCSCEENFVPKYTAVYQSFYCEEKDKEKNMLIYATNKGEIKAIRGYANHSILIGKSGKTTAAIAAANENVYWGGLYDKYQVIGKIPFSGKNPTIILDEGIGEVNALDVDWRTGNIYFIDNVKKRISACTENGSRCIEIHSLDYIATGIALAPRLGYMFWSMMDAEYGFVIKKSDMNGQVAHNFLDEGLRNISSISVDEAAEKLYWIDPFLRKIEVVRFDGTGRKIFKSDLRMEYLHLTVNARYLYWITANNGSIFFTTQTRLQPKYAINETDIVELIYGYSHSEKTTTMKAPCSWGCNNGICLMHSLYYNKTGSDCVCWNSKEIEKDGIWCHENADHYFGYHYEDDYYFYGQDSPHTLIRIILAITSFIAVVSGIAFYAYRKGFLATYCGIDGLKHHRMTNN